ncbi:hypothetical protein [Tissierella praeacuta]|uniref:hypothetical protein n=1 Tax=Tissierella praeacuta TaxID=43131 RepID=UPI002FDA1811
MNKQVNPDLYDFMKENEVHLWQQPYTNEGLQINLFLGHYDIESFIKKIGRDYFSSENEIMINLQDCCIVIDVYDIIVNYFGHKISDYSSCFLEDEWEEYKDLILESEGE